MIKQSLLADCLRLDNERKELDRNARKLQKEIDAIELSIEESLRQGEPIQQGALTATLKEGGKYPPWKQIFEDRLGKAAVAEVIASTAPKITVSITPVNGKAFTGKGREID